MNDVPTPLDFLKAVYLNEELPLSVRLRAATEAAQYMHPKLGAVATLSVNGDTFAAMLDRAIERSGTAMKLIEHQPDDPS
jgi:hypothetical protein